MAQTAKVLLVVLVGVLVGPVGAEGVAETIASEQVHDHHHHHGHHGHHHKKHHHPGAVAAETAPAPGEAVAATAGKAGVTNTSSPLAGAAATPHVQPAEAVAVAPEGGSSQSTGVATAAKAASTPHVHPVQISKAVMQVGLDHQLAQGATEKQILQKVNRIEEELTEKEREGAARQHLVKKIGRIEQELEERERAAATQKRKAAQELEERERAAAERKRKAAHIKGHLVVNGPVPIDFSDIFADGVARATGCRAKDVRLIGVVRKPNSEDKLDEIVFESRRDVTESVEEQASDPESDLARGPLRTFLFAKQAGLEGNVLEGEEEHRGREEEEDEEEEHPHVVARSPKMVPKVGVGSHAPEVDIMMPYGDLEPFGREDTAKELTESSIRESDAMVDQLERAEVAEEKRAVFRALTRLRGAAITSYDGIARAQTGNVDEYARENQWRTAHPVHHLAQDEADITRWAFPEDNAD